MLNDHDPIEGGDRASLDRVTALERRSRWLLQTSPEDLAWPRLRDVRALATGGLKARAAQNRRLSAAANLRIAVMAGVSMYLVLIGADDLGNWVIDPGPLRYEWRGMALGLLILATVLAVWLAARVPEMLTAPAGSRGDLLRWQRHCAVLDLHLAGGVRRGCSSANAALSPPAAYVAMAHRRVRWGRAVQRRR